MYPISCTKKGRIMDYYRVKDVMEILDVSRSYAYKILTQLREMFVKEYPDAMTVEGRIPKWFFEKKFKNREE